MDKFDPQKHRVVAVPYLEDDPERGQHFHVDLKDLVDAATAQHGGETVIVSRETPDERVEFLAKKVNALEARITELENRPVVSDDMLRQLNDALHAKMDALIDQKVNRNLGDLRSRLVTVEKSSTSITKTGHDPDSAKLTRLAAMLQSFGEMVREIETTLEARVSDCEQRYVEMSEHITENNLKVMKMSTRLYRALAALEHDDEGKAA